MATRRERITLAFSRIVAKLNDLKSSQDDKIEASDYASDTTGGTIKMRVDGTDLYITNDGSNA